MTPWISLAVLSLAPAADPVTVAFPKLEAGQRFAVEATRSHDLTLNTIVNGKPDSTTDKMAPSWDYTVTIDEVAKDGTPTKYRRTFGKATAILGKQTKPLSFENREVVFEKKDKRWSASIKDSKPLNGIEGRLAVAEEGELPTVPLALFTPTKPVAVGESWQPDMKAALVVFSKDEYLSFDTDKAKVSAKLVKTYEKDGKGCGVIEFQFTAPVVSLKGQIILPAENGSTIAVEAKLDGCIDGSERRFSRTSKSLLKFSTSTELRGQAVQLSSAAEITQSETVRPAGK